MAKIQIKSEKLTPFGGIFSIMEKFEHTISPVIDQALGLDTILRAINELTTDNIT